MNKIEYITDIAGKLKDLKRTGWIKRNIPSPESVADHSFSVVLLTLLLCPKELDKLKCLELAIVHDIQESIVGDIVTVYSDNDEICRKDAQEMDAIKDIAEKLKHPQLLDLFKEHQENQTPEAQFVNGIDKLEACLQAKYYVENKLAPPLLFEEFQKNAIINPKTKDKEIKKLITDLSLQP